MSDRLIRGVFPRQNVRFAVCQAAGLCEEAIRRHQADSISGWLLSEALTCAALASIQLKDPEKLTLRWIYPGPVGTILVDTTDRGEVRGFPQRLRLMPEINTLTDAIGGEGRVAATSSLPNRMGPMGITPAVFGDVARDLAHLFFLSFQIETALVVGLVIPSQEPITLASAAGVLLQPLPGSSLEAFETIRGRVEDPAFRRWLEAGPRVPEEVLARLGLRDPDGVEEMTPSYRCDCTRVKVESVLRMLGPEELLDMIDRQGKADVSCHFCATAYRFSKADLQTLLRQSSAGNA